MSKYSKLIIILLVFHVLLIFAMAMLVYFINKDIRFDAKIINIAGQIRGGTQVAIQQYFASTDNSEVVEAVQKNINILKQSEYITEDNTSGELFSIYEIEWNEIKNTMQSCVHGDAICEKDLLTRATQSWRQSNAMINLIQKDAELKLSRTNYLYYFLFVEIVAVTAVLILVYFGISRRLEVKHDEAIKYTQIIDKFVISSWTDLKGNIIDVSTAFQQNSGYRKDELIGQNHRILRHPDTEKELYEKLWSTIVSGRTWEGELQNITKNKTPFWVQASITPDYDYKGRCIGYRAIYQNITDKKVIEKISVSDRLTDLFNRVKLDAELAKERERAIRSNNSPLSVILLDLDHFKSVNDTFGHLVGDKVLVELAKILKRHKRSIDIVGRWGGEEFLIICPNTDLNGALTMAEKMRAKISDYNFNTVGQKTASFGVSSLYEDEEIETLLDRADKALYLAKKNGRNQVQPNSIS
ncbi:MAG: diguanylate cyclase [Rhodospirillaceae bacterium]